MLIDYHGEKHRRIMDYLDSLPYIGEFAGRVIEKPLSEVGYEVKIKLYGLEEGLEIYKGITDKKSLNLSALNLNSELRKAIEIQENIKKIISHDLKPKQFWDIFLS